MSDTFKIGDIVQLKSGGPKMTVTAVLGKVVHTAWFSGSKKETGAFPFDAIIIHQESTKS